MEFIRIEDDAAALLKQGHTLKSAYECLCGGKNLKMKYDTFRRYVHSRIFGLPKGKGKEFSAPSVSGNHAAGVPALPESAPARPPSVPARRGAIRTGGETSKFDANNFDIDELGPTRG